MGSSKKQTVGYRYFMGMHLAVCSGPVDALLEIRAGDRTTWYGQLTASGSININAPELFGGEEREGGLQGTLDVMMGEPAQAANSYLTSVQGAAQPAYRGILSAVFRKGLVSANNPYIKPWAFKVRRILQGWHGGTAWYPEKAQVVLPQQQERLMIADTKIPGNQARTTHTGGFTIAGFSPNDVVILRKLGGSFGSPSGVFQAWSAYASDAGPNPSTPAPNMTWLNEFRVTNAAGVMTTYLPILPGGGGWYATKEQAAAASAGFQTTLTGSTSYTIWLYDPNPSDDRGGLSLSVSVASGVRAMNPAHIIYQCLTDPEWGMGYSSSIINDTSFREAADTFHAEGMGLCLHWTQQQPIEDFIQVVLDHCGAVLRQDPRTGLFVLKPMRADYDVGTIPVFDESCVISVESYQRAASPDAVNEISVRYDDATTGKQSSVSVQNLAAVTAQGGVVSQPKSYPGLPTAELASRVAMRDLQVASSNLARVTLKITREAYLRLPGDVVKLVWPKLGIASLVLRVLRVNTGRLQDGEITVEAAEDVFGLGAASYVAQPPTGWQEQQSNPVPVAQRLVTEAPYYELQRSLGAADLAALTGTEGYLFVAGGRPQTGAQSYGVATRGTGSGLDFEEGAVGDFCPVGSLDGAIDPDDTAAVFAGMIDASLVEVGSYAVLGSEIVRIDAFDSTTGAATIGRGVLDTVAAAHADGTPIIFCDPLSATDSVERVDGDSLDVKMLTRASGGTLEEEFAPTDVLVFDQRPARPYPPGRLRIAGLAYPASLTNTLPVISWAHRNRLQQNLEGDESGDIGPEPGTTYTVEFRDADTNALLLSQSGITGNSYTPASPPIGDFSLRVLVWSVRAGLQSLQRQDHTVESYVYQTPSRILTAAASFIPGAAFSPDPLFSSVILLLYGNGTNGSTTIIDSSSAARTMTANGNASISTVEKKYGTASLFFDGAGDYIRTPYFSDLNFGTGDFTIEMWIYPRTMPTSGFATLGSCLRDSPAKGWRVLLRPDGRIEFSAYWSGSGFSGTIGGTPINASEWSHIAICRVGTVITFYVNGLVTYTTTGPAGSGPVATDVPFDIGFEQAFIWPFNGYIDDYRITKGVARYTGPFTPPTSELPRGVAVLNSTAGGAVITPAASLIAGAAVGDIDATAPGDPTLFDALFIARARMLRGPAYNETPGSILLLLHMDGTSGSTTFTDSSTYAHAITAVRDAEITTADVQFGSGALELTHGLTNIDADYLRVGSVGATPTEFLNFFNGSDWTIEGWAKFDLNAGGTLFGLTVQNVDLSFTGVRMGFQPFGGGGGACTFFITIAGVSTLHYNGTTEAPIGQWFHFAFVSSDGGQVRCYVDGVNDASFYVGISPTPQDYIPLVHSVPSTASPTIGGGSGGLTDGRVDEFRISRFARYTKDFTPPAGAFTDP
jgi:Concanavalin A-like lectin/glucanases superfamily/Putative phage tail protein